MSVYVYIAAVAVIIKVYLWYASRHCEWVDGAWFFLVISLTVTNLIELVGYIYVAYSSQPLYLLKTHYIASIVLLLSMLLFISAKESKLQQALVVMSSLLGVALVAVLVFSDRVIAGFENTQPVSAERGDLFSLYVYFGALISVLCFGLAMVNLVSAKSIRTWKTYLYHLLSLTPFMVAVIYLVVGITLHADVNGSGLAPITGTLFMAVTIYLKRRPEYLSGSAPQYIIKKISSRQALHSYLDWAMQGKSLKEGLDGQEKVMLSHLIAMHGRNQSLISKQLGIDRRTLGRKLKKHGL